MLTDPTEAPSIVTVQLPEERVHVIGVKATEPEPVCDQATVPMGVPVLGAVAATVAVQVVDVPAVTEVSVQDVAVVVVADMYGVPAYWICWMIPSSTVTRAGGSAT